MELIPHFFHTKQIFGEIEKVLLFEVIQLWLLIISYSIFGGWKTYGVTDHSS